MQAASAAAVGTAAPGPVSRGSTARSACLDRELPLAGRWTQLSTFAGCGRGLSRSRAGGGG